MPISSQRLSQANDHIITAIAHAQLAADLVRDQQTELHLLALKEGRINRLIDVVRWETRIREALLTLKGIRDSPGMDLAVRGAVSAGARGRSDSVDEQSSGGNVVAGPESCSGSIANDRGSAAFAALLKACGHHVQSEDRDSPSGVEV